MSPVKARLIVLREFNAVLLGLVLDLLGSKRSPDWMRTQLRAAEEICALVLRDIDTTQAARASEKGDHAEAPSVSEGMKKAAYH